MTRAKQKRWEHYVLEEFASLCPDFPAGERQFGDKPDLIVKGESTVGIEQTDFAWKEQDREQEQWRRNVCASATRMWRDEGNPPIYAWIHFGTITTRTKTDKLAAGLMELPRCYLPSAEGAEVEIRPHPCPGKAGDANIERLIRQVVGKSVQLECKMPPGIERLHILRRSPPAKSLFGPVEVSFVPPSDANRLQEVINRKSESLPGYQECSKYWLVIACGRLASTDIDLERGTTLHQYDSGFERVWLLNLVEKQLIELPVRKTRSARS